MPATLPPAHDGALRCRATRALLPSAAGAVDRRGALPAPRASADAPRAASTRPASDTIARMRIAQIAPPWISVPPRGYGGTEWVVQQLCDGLAARGHQVTLYASGDSRTAAELRSVFPAQIPEFMGNPAFEARHSGFALADILSRTGERAFDLVHDHSGFFVVAAAGLLHLPPVLHTIHSAFDEVTTGFYEQFGRSVAFNAISEHQRSTGPAGMNWAGVVHNAIDLERMAASRPRRTTTCWPSAASARPRASTSPSRWRAAPAAA